MEDFEVTCPLVPSVPHLISGSCSSPRAFGLGFLQTPPRDDALALLLAFGSSYTWHRDLHPTSSVPCLAHTLPLQRVVRQLPAKNSEPRTALVVANHQFHSLESAGRRHLRIFRF